MKFSDLMGEPESDPPVFEPEVASSVGEPGFAQLNVTEPTAATPAENPSEADRLEGLETIDDDLLPQSPRRSRK